MRIQRTVVVCAASLLAGGVTWAQVGRGGSEWLTAQADAQRTSWIRTDAKISRETMATPGFELQWTSKTGNASRQLNGLAQGVTANGVTLFVPVSIVAGSSNNVYMIDNDTGYVVWQRHFDTPLPPSTAACAGGITAAATRIVNVTPPPIAAPAPARGRGAVGYRTLLGDPGEGVPVEVRGGGPGRAAGPPPAGGAAGQAGRAGAPPAAAPGGPGGRGAGAPGVAGTAGIPGAPSGGGPGAGLGRPSGVAYVVSSDGMLHVLGLQSGKDLQPPAPFLPANVQWSDAIAVGTTLYAATTGSCGAPAGVWAIDLDNATSKAVMSWKTNGGAIVGNVAFTSDGTLLVAVGAGRKAADGYANAIVALDAKTLGVKDWFSQPNAEFVTGPMVMAHGPRNIVAAGTKDGRVVLLDGASLGGANHSRPLYASRVLTTGGATFAADGALATWQEVSLPPAPVPSPTPGGVAAASSITLGTQWILAPMAGRLPGGVNATNGAVTAGAVLALKLVDSGGRLSLAPAWTSHNLVAPATPIIVNGVVFALSTGRPAAVGQQGAAAVLHAYDGATGKSLWTSQQAMTTFASPRSFWSAMGQVYVGTHDGTVYAFGFLDERR